MKIDRRSSGEVGDELNLALLLPHTFLTSVQAITAAAEQQAEALKNQGERARAFIARTDKLVL